MILGVVDEKLSWYISRSAGLIAWAMVTASVVWGLSLSTRLIRKRGAPAWLLDLHRFLGTLSIVFTVIHLIALPFDKYANITIPELFVPFHSVARGGYEPQPIAWGIASFYLLIAIQITSWIKKHLPRKFWHAIHLGSFPLFVAATVHGFKAGTESRNRLVIWFSIICGIAVVFLTLFRIFSKVGEGEKGQPNPDDEVSIGADGHVSVERAPRAPRADKGDRPANPRIPASARKLAAESAAAASEASTVEETTANDRSANPRIPASARKLAAESAAAASAAAETQKVSAPIESIVAPAVADSTTLSEADIAGEFMTPGDAASSDLWSSQT